MYLFVSTVATKHDWRNKLENQNNLGVQVPFEQMQLVPPNKHICAFRRRMYYDQKFI